MDGVINTYAAYSKEDDIRLESSSGGMFTTLALYILENKGAVYGAAMCNDCKGAEYVRATTAQELSRIRGSKYMQAKIGFAYKLAKQDLDEGKYVLFTGTGCYINGLKMFLQKDYENLFCMDIVCHGTPSPKLWRNYVEFQESNFHAKMVYASFRNKDKHDWNAFEMKEIDENHTEYYISRHIDPYFSMFVKNICLRPSCYNCTAKKMKLSDITVADFWGIDNIAPEMNDNLGISLVITRSDKGQILFDSIKQNLNYKVVAYEEAVRENKAEYESYPKPKERNSFFIDMNRMTFDKLSKKYLRIPLLKKCTIKIKAIIKKLFFWGGVNEYRICTHEDYGMLLSFEKEMDH